MNKRGVTLDLKSVAGKEIALRLVQWADVLVGELPAPASCRPSASHMTPLGTSTPVSS